MPTKKQFISDVILRVTAGKPSDDLELEPRQIAFWIDQVLNSLVKQALDDRLQKGNGVDPVYIYPQYNSIVQTTQLNGTDVFFIDLEQDPMNLHRDGGIVRVSNNDNLGFVNKVKNEELDDIRNLKMSKPSLKNLMYTRSRNRIFLWGLDLNTYALYNFDIFYVPMTRALEILSDTDVIYVGEDIIPIVSETITKMAKDELFGSPNDLQNDAMQPTNNPQK